ncbi:SMP-30/gluconolactonase/LRE family protein [Roseomonas sp. HF4]|uniref:SMP-30/gluconolactonase/LRE family protein n=1 Tax=Roseomonas sp. HF4 TaxID=2562313 RepID=UPI0010BFAF05|nr:SMP-30/gluconolactonase/LRE family protein [Roseomonas sp. HF4]
MYAAPPSVTAEVHAELPEALRIRGRGSEWLYGRGGATPHSFLEGPSFDRAGDLWLTDIVFGRIFRVSQAGEWRVVADYDGEPNGLAFHRDGWAAITDAKRGLLRLDPETGAVTPLVPRARREGFRGVNDCTFAMNGDLFFTDQGQTGLHDPAGRVYRLRAGAAQADALVSNVPSPNGLVLTGDAHTLYVAATRDNAIWRVPITEDGGVIRVGRFIAMSGGLAGPDGMAMDVDGNIAVAHAGMGTVWIFSRLGEPLLRIRSPRGLGTTNVCFGGPDNSDLFITESETGTVLRTRWERPGAPLFAHV